MKTKILILLMSLLALCFAFCGCGEKEDAATAELFPKDGILICTIDGTPYYYDQEYLFKTNNYAYPDEPDEKWVKHAILTELFYREALEAGKTVTDDFLERNLEERNLYPELYEEQLADPEIPQEMVEQATNYLTMLDDFCEKENLTRETFWENNLNYVKKGCLVNLFAIDMYDEFLEISGKDLNAYEAYFLSDPYDLFEKYNVEIVAE